MSKKKKRVKKAKRPFNPLVKDLHHILWTAAKWDTGYAKKLRLHPWLIVAIPRDTLHKQIHSEIAMVPLPKEGECKRAYAKLLADLESGVINDNTPLEERIDWLIDVWQFEDSPKTSMSLLMQKEIVHNFYRKPPA